VAADRGRPGRADDRAHRLRQDPRRVPGLSRPPLPRGSGRPPGRPHRDPVRLAAQGPVQRRAPQLGGAARRAGDGSGGRGPARPRNPDRGAHRRHSGARAAAGRPPAASRAGHHARVALHPAHRGVEPRLALPGPHRDRGRDPRGGGGQTRGAPRALPGAARGAGGLAGRLAAAARRPLGHRAPHRDRGAAAGGIDATDARGGERGPAARHGPGHRGAGRRAGRGVHQRAVGGDLRPGGRAGARAPLHPRVRQHPAPRRARDPPPGRSPGRGTGRRAPQQPEPAAAVRRRAAAQVGRAVAARNGSPRTTAA